MMTCRATRLVCFCCAVLIGLAGGLRPADAGRADHLVAMVICGAAGDTVVWLDSGDDPACDPDTCALCVLGSVAVLAELPLTVLTGAVSRSADAPGSPTVGVATTVAAAQARGPPDLKEIA